MCGIIGCAGDLNQSHEKLTRTLLILDSLRGEDSTGVVAVAKYMGNIKIAKQVGDPFQLFDHKSYDALWSGFQRAIIGHNRYATTGGVSRHNAHPFENKSVVGVHNGTLRSKHLLADAKDFVVDSENVYHHIDKHGLKDALHYMDGAWALVWWDKDRKSMNFLRNKERPLYMVWSKDAKVLFWASEPWMLYAGLTKHGLGYQEIFQLDEDIHYELPINDKGELGKPISRAAPSTYRAYVAPVTTTVARGYVEPAAKKEEPAPATVKKLPLVAVPQSCDTSYLSKKGVCIETLCMGTDEHGAKYISCYDPQRQFDEIRLYARPRDPLWDLIGCDIIGNISGWSASGNTPGRGYYKVSPHDFKIVVPAETTEDEEEEFVFEASIMGPKGKFISKAEFEKEYAQCEWCTDNLIFGGGNRFTTTGQCLCPSCAEDKAINEVVTLI